MEKHASDDDQAAPSPQIPPLYINREVVRLSLAIGPNNNIRPHTSVIYALGARIYFPNYTISAMDVEQDLRKRPGRSPVFCHLSLLCSVVYKCNRLPPTLTREWSIESGKYKGEERPDRSNFTYLILPTVISASSSPRTEGEKKKFRSQYVVELSFRDRRPRECTRAATGAQLTERTPSELLRWTIETRE
ncbi:hypothetical protein DM02DRAFT_226021 [Periconia macrospinosa]|uniref:Uncharacterized protein n=1 Tax=Periconia macrospinosa TaxID=97972 RepID=A0A2V1E3G0_9PLEO|nr:hypothetical protein DM02DRAFT_226021 [Periconia macrospinosa]